MSTSQPVATYFAHPAFTQPQLEFKEKFREIIEKLPEGVIRILDPFEYSPAIEGDREVKKMISKAVVDANEQLIDQSELIIALIDDRDQGVLWEMGYAYARKIPIISISAHNYDVNLMLSGTVMAHVPNVLENEAMFRSVLETFHRVRRL